MEYETNQQASLWQRLKDSPRTVSALIIILVIAAAIYAFSGSSPAEAPQVASPTSLPEEGSQEDLQAKSESLPAAEETDEGYVEKAEAGDGATHLARRAATRYLAEHTPSYGLTNEHRIYIEDYIQKKLGSPRLEVGEAHTVSFALIQEAVEAAGKLSPTQLKNLSKYTSALK